MEHPQNIVPWTTSLAYHELRLGFSRLKTQGDYGNSGNQCLPMLSGGRSSANQLLLVWQFVRVGLAISQHLRKKRDPGFGTDCRSISNMIQVVAEGLFCRSKTIRNHRKAKTLDHRPVLEKAIDDFVVGTCPQVALLTLDYSLTQGYCWLSI